MSEATLSTIREAARDGPCAVVIVARAEGSTPRTVGAFMVVTGAQFVGTIGGGEAERRAIIAARTLLEEGRQRETLVLPLGPDLDQCCGGRLTVEIVRIDRPPDGPLRVAEDLPAIEEVRQRPLLIYGAGHVGTALMRACAPLPFACELIDGRAEAAWPGPPDLDVRRLALPETAALAAPSDAVHLVMTHSHALDLEIVAAALSGPAAFVGLIGSATKAATFRRRLRERGIDPSPLVCPIGLGEIEGKEPAVIAASVVAQLLSLGVHRLAPSSTETVLESVP